jgi:hypothetical protein
MRIAPCLRQAYRPARCNAQNGDIAALSDAHLGTRHHERHAPLATEINVHGTVELCVTHYVQHDPTLTQVNNGDVI